MHAERETPSLSRLAWKVILQSDPEPFLPCQQGQKAKLFVLPFP